MDNSFMCQDFYLLLYIAYLGKKIKTFSKFYISIELDINNDQYLLANKPKYSVLSYKHSFPSSTNISNKHLPLICLSN